MDEEPLVGRFRPRAVFEAFQVRLPQNRIGKLSLSASQFGIRII